MRARSGRQAARGRWQAPVRAALCLAGAALLAAAFGQVIEFESNGLRYLTQTRNGVTIMFAHLPVTVRDYSVIQVAVSNGSKQTWIMRPEDFEFTGKDNAHFRATPARSVVERFISRGGRDDAIKLVATYEMGLYGFNRLKATNGYEARRQALMAEMTSTKIKAAAAASAIVFVTVKLKPGESTDGAVFFASQGRHLGPGRVQVAAAGTVFEFETQGLAAEQTAGR
ncbi:MAG: hypothetical protein IT163_05990 [Bryobacterales bacterium]|nr:hypothetical protein [Bryobacterales bacterium]